MENQVSRKSGTPVSTSKSKQKSTLTSKYLLAYNGICLLLWTILTGRALLLTPLLYQHDKLHSLFQALWPLHPFAQGLALLEVVHALTGLVRASPVTTAMQVASRILVVFGILYLFPQVVVTKDTFGWDKAGGQGGPLAFTALVFAHGVTEVIRYGFFVYKEGIGEKVPGWLLWLRYNTFFVLYPLGISSECWLIYLALEPAKKSSITGYDLLLRAVLFIYVPGSYILYTHMMSQRRKVLKGKGKQS